MSKVAASKVRGSFSIHIQGASENNLKNLSLQLPKNKLIVFTGVSGSGKTSLVMDVLYAEGQRSYAESLSSYTRQFMERMKKPKVEYIKGLSPAIAIHQKNSIKTPRSSVGSITELYDYIKLLFGRIGKIYHPLTHEEMLNYDSRKIVEELKTKNTRGTFHILCRLQANNTETKLFLASLLQKGFTRLWKQDSLIDIESILEEGKVDFKNSFLLIDRIKVQDWNDLSMHYRFMESLDSAFFEGHGEVYLQHDAHAPRSYSSQIKDGAYEFESPTPNLFSYNNAYGACPTCEGHGMVLGIDQDLVMPNKQLSVFEGAVAPWKGEKLGSWKEQFIAGAKSIQFPIHKPLKDLSKKEMDMLWKGQGSVFGINDFFQEVERNLYKIQYRVLLSRYRGKTACPSCEGSKLRKAALYIQVHGKTILDINQMPLDQLQQWLQETPFSQDERITIRRVLLELDARLKVLLQLGLPYLTLSRSASTLSGGEGQRIQLSKCIGSNLSQSLYILDEPSVGLHAVDTKKLIDVLFELRDLGNTVIVIEHDEQIMQMADHIVDIGPLAGHRGGEIMAQGNINEIKKSNSLTAQYLAKKKEVSISKKNPGNDLISIKNAYANNLKNIDVAFPLGTFVAICGVSGSGKSSLINEVLYESLNQLLIDGTLPPHLKMDGLEGNWKKIKQVELITQQMVGISSRSNPATYSKVWDDIRHLYAQQEQSKANLLTASHFSFNVPGGRCETCEGNGEQLIEMQFLADMKLLCEECKGLRFKKQILEVNYLHKNIAEVLSMSIDEAVQLFQGQTKIVNKLLPFQKVGLGYLQLGQSTDTFSGGELQRLKLALYLQEKKTEPTLFIFDEPSTGLHYADIQNLLDTLQELLNKGHSLIVVEHNLDIIRNASWIIELGPSSGMKGGELLYQGKYDDWFKQKTPSNQFL